MLFEKFQSNPFEAKCESAQENKFETSLVPGREIAAAAAVSNVILPGGNYLHNLTLHPVPNFCLLLNRFMCIWIQQIFPVMRSWWYHQLWYNTHNGNDSLSILKLTDSKNIHYLNFRSFHWIW